jgi:hypothetical protein
MPHIVFGNEEEYIRRGRMERKIIVRNLHDPENRSEADEYNDNASECLDIVERLRREAGKFIYGNPTTFQRTVTVVRRKGS